MAHSALYQSLFSNKKTMFGGKQMANLFSLIREKKYFLMKIFLTLIIQILITIYVFMKANGQKLLNTNMKYFGLIILLFVIVIMIVFVSNPFIKFILFTIFSICVGLFLSVLKEYYSPDVIKTALYSTLSIFGTMILLTLFFVIFNIEIDPRLGYILLFTLLLVIVIRIVFLFIPPSSTINKWLCVFVIMLFAIYIVYDTYNILVRDYYGNDFITPALDYYLDIINIFVNMLGASQ